MTKELSALFDGELEVHEESSLWATMKANSGLRQNWREYKLIGDALRDESDLNRDITAKVMRELSNEPVVFAPRPKQPLRWPKALMALAASAAGIAVVGWLALTQQLQGGESTTLARVERPTIVTVAAPAPTPGMQEYMLAHQANAPGLYLQGGAEHIRTVSVVGIGK